jgi:hypothetical protein
LDEEKAKHAGLAQQNGYGPAFFSQDAWGWQNAQQTQHLLLIG